jgi:hypothetical protein
MSAYSTEHECDYIAAFSWIVRRNEPVTMELKQMSTKAEGRENCFKGDL